ncbi:MAG: asparagine synthase-related protein [Gemmatimonadales bacterium]
MPGAAAGVRTARNSEQGSSRIIYSSRTNVLELYVGGDLAEVTSAVSPSGATTVVFEGVLYNAGDLRSVLQLSPTVTLADLLVAAYERWRERALERIKGIYALIIWDAERNTLLCVRDRLGVFPLFIASARGQCVTSPDIEAVRSHPIIRAPLNRIALAGHLAHHWPKADETYFEGVRRVPPGNVLAVSRGSETLSRYWDPSPTGEPINWVEPQQIEQFNDLLDQAVARTMDGDAAIFLSGGIDSISIAAVAAERARATGGAAPLALSLGFPHPDCNEEDRQRAVAADLGLPIVLKPLHEALGRGGLISAGLSATAYSPFPLINIWLTAYHNLAVEAVARGRKVILGGGGGDEWLSVTPFLAADLMSSFEFLELFRLWRTQRRSWPLSAHRTFLNIFWRFGLRLVLMAGADRFTPRLRPALHRRHVSGRLPPWLAPYPGLRRELENRILADAPRYRIGHFYADTLRAGVEHALVSMEMEEQFVTWRHLGVRVLHPYWDADLIEFLWRVPPAILNRHGRSKGLVRQTLAQRFPQLGFDRQKKVLATNFVRETILREARPAWSGAGGAPTLASLGVVEPTLLKREMDAIMMQPGSARTYRIWDVLNVESWARSRI